MLYCKECDTHWDETDPDETRLHVERDGDTYDPSINFWYTCPFCGETLEEVGEEES